MSLLFVLLKRISTSTKASTKYLFISMLKSIFLSLVFFFLFHYESISCPWFRFSHNKIHQSGYNLVNILVSTAWYDKNNRHPFRYISLHNLHFSSRTSKWIIKLIKSNFIKICSKINSPSLVLYIFRYRNYYCCASV